MMERWIARSGAAVVIVALAGCAATVQLPENAGPKLAVSAAASKQVVLVVDGSKTSKESKDWEQFRGEWRTAIEAAGKERGVAVLYQDSATPVAQQPAVLAWVNINDYRYITQGARFAVGIMTGNAFVDAEVTFYEWPANTAMGTRKYNTTSSAGQGIFAAMTEKQVKAICDQIVKEVAQR